MRVSPSIEVQEHEMKNMQPGNKLGYIAAIFKGTVGIGMPATQMTGDVVSKRVDPPWPGAALQIEGPTNYAWDIVKHLETFHGIPQRYIKVISKSATSFNNVGSYLTTAKISIEYYPKPATTKTVGIQFSVADAFDMLQDSLNVDIELSQDGATVNEISAEITKLKWMIKQQVDRNGLRNIKVATKPIGIVSWEREVSTKAQQEIKLKLKTVLEGEIKLPVGGGGAIGGGTGITVQFYGSLFKQYQEDGAIRKGVDWEAGFMIVIPLPGQQPVHRGPYPPAGPRIQR